MLSHWQWSGMCTGSLSPPVPVLPTWLERHRDCHDPSCRPGSPGGRPAAPARAQPDSESPRAAAGGGGR
jgi:hypothetical protein